MGSRTGESATELQPRGVIHNVESDGRLDLVIYDDGILAVKGTYLGVALRGAGAGMVGAGGAGSAGAGVAAGTVSGQSYERKRLIKVLVRPRQEVLGLNSSNTFVARDGITALVLRKRWHGHSLTIKAREVSAGRRFSWKPAFNRFSDVEAMLTSTFGRLVSRE